MNSPRLPPDDDERDRKRLETDRLRRRWMCWGVGLALVGLWAVFVAIDDGRRIDAMPTGTATLFVVVVLVLFGAGWVVGRDEASELLGRNAALAEMLVHLQTVQHERIGVYVRQAQRLHSRLDHFAEELKALQNVVADSYVDRMSEGPGLRSVPRGRRPEDPKP